jgi:S-layer family protein
MKKVLSLVLVLAMVLSSMSFAFAGTFEDVADTDYSKAVDTLTALGVVTGYEDGTYRPDKTITRAEMAKLMVVTLGYGDLVAGSKSNFTDTQGHWADPYVALAAGKGMVVGTGNGKFDPDRTVTYDEVYTMLVRGLGYTDTCNELKGMTWPTNFKVKAAELGITKDVEMTTTGADRGGVAQAIFNALEATLVTVDTDGNVTNILDRSKNGVELLSRIADLDEDYVVSEELLDSNNKNYAGNMVDLAPYMFQSLKVYLNDDDEVVFVKGSNSLVYEGEIDDVETVSGDTTISVENANGKIKKVTLDSIVDTAAIGFEVFENGKIKDNSIDYKDLLDTETIKIVAMDDKDLLTAADDDGKIDEDEIQGIVTTLRTRVVRVEKAYVEGKDSIDGIDLPLDSDDEVDFANLNVSGDAEELGDIKVDDIVVVYAAEDNDVVNLVVTRNEVEGKVTKVTDKNTVSVDGTSYDLSSKNLVGDWALELGDEGVFYLDQFGDIADYDGESVGPTDYAVVIGAGDGDVTTRFGTSVDVYPELKLATQDGEEIVYELEVDLDSTTGEVESSVEITSTTGTEYDLFAGPITAGVGVLDVDTLFASGTNFLIKYSLNADGRIDEIELEYDVNAYTTSGSGLDDVDLDKDELADGVVVFDAGDDFAVVDIDVLDTEFEAYAVENKNGDFEVLVVRSGEVDEATSTIFAYLNKVTRAYNEDGKKVNVYTVYVDGVKKDIFADDDAADILTYNYAINFDYNGNVIDETDVDVVTATVAGVTTHKPTQVIGVSATATAINASKGRIEINVGGSVTFDADSNGTTDSDETFRNDWYSLSDHATVVVVDPTTSTPNGVDKIADLYDIDENDAFKVFFNADGEIDLIVVTK